MGGAGAGFGVYHSGGPGSSFCLREPSEVFTSEMSAIVALIQIRTRRLGRYLIVTDSSLKALQTQMVAPRSNPLGLLVTEEQ
jgi:hypothetical protein